MGGRRWNAERCDRMMLKVFKYVSVVIQKEASSKVRNRGGGGFRWGGSSFSSSGRNSSGGGCSSNGNFSNGGNIGSSGGLDVVSSVVIVSGKGGCGGLNEAGTLQTAEDSSSLVAANVNLALKLVFEMTIHFVLIESL